MPVKQISRWTMLWYANALVFLIIALAAVVLGLVTPLSWREGSGLAVVHLFTIGWLGQVMLGSLTQMLPVLTSRPLVAVGLVLPVLVLMTGGTVMLVAGFLGLAGWHDALWLLAVAPILLGLGLLGAVIMLAGTVIASGAWRQVFGVALLLALLAVVMLWLSGAGMARALAGSGAGSALLGAGLPFHILAGIGGWLGLASFAVSYRLFAMVLGASGGGRILRRLGLCSLAGAVALIGAGLATVMAGGYAALPLLGAMLAFALAVGLYLADITGLWRRRLRPLPEVNMQVSRIAMGFLALTVLLTPAAIWWQGVWPEVVIFLALAGWLSTMTLAQMIKIVSFLTWLQVFSTRIGRHPVPLTQELVDTARARLWLGLWIGGTALGAVALLGAAPLIFRLAAALMLVAASGLGYEMLAIRRLDHIRRDLRPAPLPPLIFPHLRPETSLERP